MSNDQKQRLKDKFNKVVDKVASVAQNPILRKGGRFASAILETSSLVRSRNPITIGMGLASVVDAAIDAFEVPYPTKTEYFGKKHNLVSCNGALPRILVDAELDKVFPTKVAFTDNHWVVRELLLDGEKLYFGENTEAESTDSLSRLSETYLYTPNFDFKKLFDALWEYYSHGAHISIFNTKRKRWEEHHIRLHQLVTDDYSYLGKLDPIAFAKKADEFRKAGISRSFMLAGPPGSGKTSYVYEVARAISNRIIKIDSSVAHALTGNDLDFLIQNLKPDVLVFDDFDRASLAQDTMSLLFLLENLKNRFPHTIIFATVNNFEKLDKAIVRPGRFDKIIWFDLPDEKVRKEIAIKYLNSNNVSYDEELLQKIANVTKGLTPVYIKELCVRMRYEGSESIDEIISEFHQTIDEDLLSANMASNGD